MWIRRRILCRYSRNCQYLSYLWCKINSKTFKGIKSWVKKTTLYMYVHVAKLIRYQELHIMDEFLAVRFKTLHCEWLVRSFAFWLVHLNIYYSNHKNPMHHLIDNYVTYVSLCMFCVLLYDAMQRNRPFWGHSFRTTLGRFSVLLFIFMYLMIYLVNDAHICTGLSLLCYWVVQTMFHVLIKIYLTNLINTLTEKCLLLFYVNHVIIFFYINIIS